ncbi:MAG: PIG-L family deacetylase [Candidatus Brocadia sp.]|jgi:LmbE family N-acetylglucosaminyl deacetylase
MRRLLRYLYEILLKTRMRYSLDSLKHFSRIHRSITILKYLKTTKTDGLKERNVLVLSPHPDDDIIGCGGTMYQYHLRGARITTVYMTDGRRGNSRYTEEELVSVRKKEAMKASAIIGVEKTIFLDNRDLELFPASKTISELLEILRDSRPQAVFLPFLLDAHPDHVATNKILLCAMKYFPSFVCYAYGIWSPLSSFNLSVDITPYIDVKRNALEEHKSQKEVFDITEASLSLSKYYSIVSGMYGYGNGKGWAEVYSVCPSEKYKKLAEAIGW